MNKLILLTVLMFSFTSLFSQAFKNEELTITKLEEGMWIIETIDNTTMYLIEGD